MNDKNNRRNNDNHNETNGHQSRIMNTNWDSQPGIQNQYLLFRQTVCQISEMLFGLHAVSDFLTIKKKTGNVMETKK